MQLKRYFLILICTISATLVFAQFPERATSSQLYHKLQKASVFGSILYIAAHPDDENTRLISYFENELLARTAYISLTRGDGGQNLIGTEIGTGIGVLRTQELLAARRIDGGEQFFTRAVDFGYSKSSDESFEKWGEENILADVVWVIRKFRPDAIVTRFPPNNYAGHGHHEASAVMAEAAFSAAADPSRFPEQLEFVEPWQPKRLYFNASSWWNKDIAERAKNSPDFVTVNVGKYNPLLGETYAQIASRSRSEHKSQGFGSDYSYGLNVEYMEYVMGDKAAPEKGILDGVERSWNRLGAPRIESILKAAMEEFDMEAPEKSAEKIVEAIQILYELEESPLQQYKIRELEVLLLDLLGLHVEATTTSAFFTKGDTMSIMLNAVMQADQPLIIRNIGVKSDSDVQDHTLTKGELFAKEISYTIPENAPFSNPYWLNEAFDALYEVNDFEILGSPENIAAVNVDVEISAISHTFNVRIPVEHKSVDPVKAVIYTPVYILPDVTFNFSEDVIICSQQSEPRGIIITVQNHAESTAGKLKLNLPRGWTSSPNEIDYSSTARGETEKILFNITPSPDAASGTIEVVYKGRTDNLSLQIIDYDHIPKQIILKPAQADLKLVNMDRGNVKLIGYIEGPGDDVAKYLRAAGYDVVGLTPESVISEDLTKYDAILSGIRLYNTAKEMAYTKNVLNDYVKNGGTYIVQYNTSRGVNADEIGPFSFEISRERVTDENAPVQFINPKHHVLNFPNKLDLADFEHWVQERGLYFAGSWANEFEPIISWSDADEPAREGGLIIAPYGKGHFAYTGISFFRQLPAGVPGAYRLMANLIALSKIEMTSND